MACFQGAGRLCPWPRAVRILLQGIGSIGDKTEIGLHWERQSMGRCQHHARAGQTAETNLGGDQGRETALLDEAHLDGCRPRSISINWPHARGDARSVRRTWADKITGWRWRAEGEVGEEESCSGFCRPPAKPRSSNVDMAAHRRVARPSDHHAHHVSPAPVNWREAARTCSATIRTQGHCPRIPHLCHQRARSAAPDRLGRCARCPAEKRLDADSGAGRLRGHQTPARLQCRY